MCLIAFGSANIIITNDIDRATHDTHDRCVELDLVLKVARMGPLRLCLSSAPPRRCLAPVQSTARPAAIKC
jgi:hypothetical protein